MHIVLFKDQIIFENFEERCKSDLNEKAVFRHDVTMRNLICKLVSGDVYFENQIFLKGSIPGKKESDFLVIFSSCIVHPLQLMQAIHSLTSK